jgi:hypothetical protein
MDVILTIGFSPTCASALAQRSCIVKLHCSDVCSVERVAHEDREVSGSAPSDDSLRTLYSGSDPRYADMEFDDAAVLLSALLQVAARHRG